MQERWNNEYRRFQSLATTAGLQPDPRGSLPDARAFAEDLVLCPSESRAVALLEANRAAAFTFLDLAMHYDEQLQKGTIRVTDEPAEGSLPFFVLAGAVLEFLKGLEKRYPQGFV